MTRTDPWPAAGLMNNLTILTTCVSAVGAAYVGISYLNTLDFLDATRLQQLRVGWIILTILPLGVLVLPWSRNNRVSIALALMLVNLTLVGVLASVQ